MSFLTGECFRLENLRIVLERTLAWCVVWILLPVTFYALEIAPKDYLAWVFALVGLALVWLLKSPINPLVSLSERTFLVLMVSLFIVLRLVWIYYISTLPVSDFAFYWDIAAKIAQFKPLTDLDWRLLHTSAWGYPTFLGLWSAIFGNDLLRAKLLSVLLGGATLVVFYKFACYFGEKVGRIAAFFFVLWPAQVMYTSVLGAEHLGMLTLMCTLLFLHKALYDSKQSITYVVLAGVFAGFTYITRSGLALILPVAILYILLFSANFTRKIVYVVILSSSFAITFGAFLFSMKAVYRVVPVTNSLFAILSGTNFESTGGWTAKDGKKFMGFNSIEEANAYAKQTAMRRIFNRPDRFFLLVTRKIAKMWGDDQYGFSWSTQSLLSPLSFASLRTINTYLKASSQYFLVFILIFSMIGCVGIGQNKHWHAGNFLVLLLLIAVILLHTIFEVQARYHFPLTPLLFILAAEGILGISLVQL